MRIIVPPGGMVGFGNQTPATQALWNQAAGKVNGSRGGKRSAKRRKAKAKASPGRRRKRSTKRKTLVKGSAAARRHMAKLRRMRKRK